MPSRVIDRSSDAVFGFFLPESSAVPTCTYGPKRPARAITGRPVSGSSPSTRSSLGLSISSRAASTVSSSGGISPGMVARCGPRST